MPPRFGPGASNLRAAPVSAAGHGARPTPCAEPKCPHRPPIQENALRPLSSFFAATALALAAAATAHAGPIVFDVAPFEGTTVNLDDGVRQVFAGRERFLPSFDFTQDRFVFANAGFLLGDSLSFFNGLAADLPSGGLNVIVVQDSDNDGNPVTAFNAIAAANLVADELSTDGAGLFVYFNSVLNVNRLVYSSKLNSRTGDLAILARVTSPTGAGAIAALPAFNAGNFAVPEPGTWALMAAGLVGVAGTRRRSRG
ncbi:MAG: hypothetical protein C0505_15150 [Leptothrix sp. (in: Bacteria)]|nr:hypothetical protein [Leptothrix sp. (in: b-proteobacteria)]